MKNMLVWTFAKFAAVASQFPILYKIVTMKNALFTLAILMSFVSFGQSQDVNGLNLNAPNGFTKAGNLHWNNGNENVFITHVKGSLIAFEYTQSQAKLYCEKGSRASEMVGFEIIEINGVNYSVCLQKGENGLSMGQSQVYVNGYAYNIVVSANPDDYERVYYILGYMIMRITLN